MKYKSPTRGVIEPSGEVGFYFYIRTAEIFSHERQIVLGHGEIRVNGVQTLYRDKRRAGRSNQVADINIAKTNSSVDGRFDEAIIKVYLSSFGRCLRLLRVRQSNVVVLLRDHLSRTQVLLSLERHLHLTRLALLPDRERPETGAGRL